MAALEKVYKCISSGQEIKLERKPDNSGWLRWNLDGTKHVDIKKPKQLQPQQQQQHQKPPQTVTVDNGPQIETLVEQVRELKETVSILISQIQGLKSEIKKC